MMNDFGQPVAAPRTNGWAIAALACGVAGVFAFPAGILAIVFGHIARREVRRTGEAGRSLATAGLILGYVALVIGVLFLIWILYIFHVMDSAAPNGMP